MDKLILQDVRCFRGRHEIPLAPLTLLVGENSTGKSTLLAAARLAWDISNGVASPDFNEEPFDWGAYDQIACTRGGRAQTKSFVIGHETIAPDCYALNENRIVRMEAYYQEVDAQPRIEKWQIIVGPYTIVVKVIGDVTTETTVQTGDTSPVRSRQLRESPLAGTGSGYDFRDSAMAAVFQSKLINREHSQHLQAILYHAMERERPYAFSPIRTRPRRTYDRRVPLPHPEGQHVPMELAKLKASHSKNWKDLSEELSRFGNESGLFKDVNVKPLGKSSDPIQVQITISGPPSNLIDVGYGVSQVLPLLVDCLSETGKMYLIQQPEVHLHPKAQAQLGSLFGYLAVNQNKQFLVETHSDHLIDRIVMDVRDGKHGLKPKDVRILYFERKRNYVRVHPMEIDDCGNLIDAPLGYRRFFLEEEKRFIGG